MAQTRRKRAGRPQRELSPGERVPMSFRVPPELKLTMDRAAGKTGRSVAQEIELRLERSFQNEKLAPQLLAAMYGPLVAGLVLFLGPCLRQAITVAVMATREHGESDEELVAEATAALVFDQMRQQIEPPKPVILAARGDLPDDQREYLTGIARHTVNWAFGSLMAESAFDDLAPHTEEIRSLLAPVITRRKKEQLHARQRHSPRQK
jgi:hypothetical protein